MQKEIQNRNFYNKGNSVPTILLKLFKSVWLKNKRDDQKKSSASASVIQLPGVPAKLSVVFFRQEIQLT